ncbi:MAG: efflux RND transporter periplasmic adaptor subunit [Candidatus Poribacteria bacterium]|nr:efflux RND transporter periplasmic adaptor subunit [Candidatus Poribacteria bacterium]
MQIKNVRNRRLLMIVVLVVLGLFTAWLIQTDHLVAQDAHDAHDEHEGDDHHEEEGIKLSAAEMKKFGFEVETAGPGKLRLEKRLPGEVRVNADRIAHVTPRVPGIVREVQKQIGDRVQAGEVMAVLDSPQMGEAQMAYLNTIAEVEVAKTNIDLAKSKLEVASTHRDVVASQVEVVIAEHEVAKTAVETAENNLDIAKAQYQIAQARFEWQKTVHDNTHQFLIRLKEKTALDDIAHEFEEKPIGENRERLLKAYATLNFTVAAYQRESALREKQISSESDFLLAQKEYVSAKAELKAISETVEFQNRLALMETQSAVEAAGRDVKAAEAAVKAAKQSLKVAEQAVKSVRQSLKSAETSIKVSEQELKVAQQTLELTQSKRRMAEQRLRLLSLTDEEMASLRHNTQAQMTRYVIRAPFEGSVVEKHIVLGESLKDDRETFVIADLSTVWVDLRVYQKELPFVRKGQPVIISAGSGIPDALGEIAYVGPLMGEQTRTVLARVVLPNPEGHWRPGLFITGRVVIDEVAVPVMLPKTALQTIAGRSTVFVKTETGFEPQSVTVGRSNGTHVEIIAGIKAGTVVAICGTFYLKSELMREQLGGHGDAH